MAGRIGELREAIRGVVADGMNVLLTTQYLEEARVAAVSRGTRSQLDEEVSPRTRSSACAC
jgi:hypothetical protein